MSKTIRRGEELDEVIGNYRQRRDERQGHNPYYTYKKRKAERRKMREDARWITIGAMPGDGRNMPKMKGRHVLIDDEGEVISGAGGSLTGVKLEGAESTSGDVKVDPSKTSDPKPESPAGKEGKSSGEVAAEAKSETKKTDLSEARKLLDNEDIHGYAKWLKSVPIETTLIFHSKWDDAYNNETYHKVGDDKWVNQHGTYWKTDDLVFTKETLKHFKNSGKWLGVVGTETDEEIKLTDKKEEEPPIELSKTWMTDFSSAVSDKEKLAKWMKMVPKYASITMMDKDGNPYCRFTKHASYWGYEDFAGDNYEQLESDVADEAIRNAVESLDSWKVYNPDTHKYYEEKTKKGEKTEPATEPKSESAEWEAKSYLDSYKDIGKTLEWVKSAPMGAAVLFTSDADDVFVIKKEADGNWYGYTSLDDDAEPVNSFKDEMAVATDLAHPDIESDTAKISVYNPKTGEIEEKILGEAPEGESAGETKGESSDDTPPWAKEFGSSISDADKFGKWAKYVPTDAEIVLKNNAGEEIAKFIKDYDGWIMVVPGEPKEYLTDLGAQDWIDKKKAKVATWEVTDPITDTVAKEKFSETAEKGFADGPESETKEPEGKKTPGTMSYATEDKASSGLTRVTYGSDAYSEAARKAAIQEAGDHAGKVKVHNKLFPGMQKWWSKLDDNQKTSLRDYTGSYHDTNEPLRGFTYTSFSKGDDHIKNKIKAIDEALDKSTLEEPLVVTRGVSLGTFNAMVEHKSSEYKTSKWDVPHYGEELVGKVLTEPSYMSCTAAGEADFSSKPVQLKIYCPAGTKGAYINPISAYGMHKPHPEDMDGSEDPTEGSEFEFLLQRGCKFKVRKITEGKSGQYEVELDLIEQNPRKLSVSGKKGIYDDGKDAYDF